VKKHFILFVKTMFRSMLIKMFHSILRHKQVVLEDTDNGFFGVNHSIYYMNLGGYFYIE
jgi:hypothetical protein